ncbi:MAG: DUF6382 domain-containing protein [Anaerovoracaceae bacterium]
MDTALVPIAAVDMEGERNRSSILISGIEAEVIESGGRRFFSLLLEESQIPKYRRKILENRDCRQLLPMQFICEQNKLRACYDYGGFLQLKAMYREWRKDGINLALENLATIVSVTASIMSAENYLFSCEDLSLHADTIFISPASGEVRLAYIPEPQTPESISVKIASLILETVQLTSDEQWTVYGEEVCDRIMSCNESMSGIEKILLDKGREISGKGWPEKSEMRRIVGNNKPGGCPA